MRERDTRSPGMLGRCVPHPPSTNFDDNFPLPAAKRIRRSDSDESASSVNPLRDGLTSDSENDGSVVHLRREIPDSDEEPDSDNDTNVPVTKTGLESALPAVKTDKQAIQDYEAARAAESTDLALQDRLSQRKWIPGKGSIYVDAFNLALETVLEDEAHLFDEGEMTIFDNWRNLTYEGQYLYVRLFLRKAGAWHRINKLGYYGDISDMLNTAQELFKVRPLPKREVAKQNHPAESRPPDDTVLGDIYTFADTSSEHISSLEHASCLLTLDELKALGKEAKFQGKNKADMVKALRRTSGRQSGLGWGNLKRSDTADSVNMEQGIVAKESGIENKENLDDSAGNRDSHFVTKILDSTGPCIRLTAAPRRLFERVHLVFYRSTEWTESSLTTIILARISRRHFPEYIVSRSANIFASRADLLEFEAAIRTQYRVDSILEFNGTVRKDGLVTVKNIFEEVYPRWKILVAEEQRKEDRVYESGEGAYLRRFSPAWIYTRIVHKGEHVLGRLREHEREHLVLSELLAQDLFHAARRGSWYQRKALLEEHYMYALQPVPKLTDEAQKKHWKRIALQTCEDGLQDRNCHLIYHYDLQKRIMKLERALKIPKREHHHFGHVRLAKPLERTVFGIRLEKSPTSSRRPSVDRRNSSDGVAGRGKGSGKTVWVDEREGGGDCSVEAMCLSHYRDLGWKGYHSEGGIVRTLFAYLFHDVLFTYVPNVFQTPYQTCPLDLHTDAFCPSRASQINHRLVEIANGDAEKILRQTHQKEYEKETCVVGLHWDYSIEDLLEIVQCFDGEALATLCKTMAQEYQQRGGGIPDLFLWRTYDTNDPRQDGRIGQVMFAEVKSENDRLSDTQRLWIHVLTGAGIPVELCAAVAKEVRKIQ